MKVRRTTATAALLAALAAAGVLLTSAGTASAQDARHRAPRPVPGMAAMHQQMTAQNPAWPGCTSFMSLGTPAWPGCTS